MDTIKLASLSHANLVIGASDEEQAASIARLNISPFDTIILDGLAANGIKDVREFMTKLLTSPQFGAIRLGIVKSADRLTPEAQNALLKTLEDPPEPVKLLLFADGESKILPTVLSRCRRYYTADKKFKPRADVSADIPLNQFVSAESWAKDDSVVDSAASWLAADYEEWTHHNRSAADLDRLLRSWELYYALSVECNKRLILERHILSSL